MNSWQRMALALVVSLQTATVLGDWPQFRGPRGDGVSDAKGLPTTWNALRNIAWQTDLPGRGWSSPVVIGDRIWVTAAVPQALDDAERRKKIAQSRYQEYSFQAYSAVRLVACELEATSGQRLRTIDLFERDDPDPIHSANSYASPTPVTDGRRLYCHFGSLGTVALALDSGRILWQRRFEVDEITGPGSSPVLWRDLLILPCDGADTQFVVAIDRETGKDVWRTPRPKIDLPDPKHRRAFSTPLLVRHGGRDQAIIPGAQWVVSYDPATGNERWRVKFGDGHAVVPRPVERDGVVYICTGYMKPKLWAIRVDGEGDVTESHVLWKFDKQVPEIASPVIVGDELYFVSSLGVLSCVGARTGELVWQHRLGGNFGASPLAAGDLIYWTSEEGTTTVIRAGRQYQEVARNQLNGLILASPAIHGGSILWRNSQALICVRSAKSGS